MMDHETLDLKVLVEPVVRKAGEILQSYYGTKLKRYDKGANDGFATEADKESERYLIDQLHQILPQAAFYAEESGVSGAGDYCWVIDPLDGTTNFAQGLPYFCISVALTYQGVPVFGAIYQPLLNEFFYAVKGHGAFLNDRPLRIDQTVPWEKSVVVVGLPYGKGRPFKHLFAHVPTIAEQTYALRFNGAVALDLAYLAAGRLDGLFCEDLRWWDVAAGMLLVSEAGGTVTDFQGNPITASYKSLAAGNRQVHERFLQVLTQ